MKRGLYVLSAVIVALAADSGAARAALAPAAADPRETAGRCVAAGLGTMRTGELAYAAVALRPTTAYRRPGVGAFARFGERNANDVATVFGVLGAVRGGDCRARWLRVQMPSKPNGVSGYVRAADVRLYAVETRIAVDLSERRVTLFRAGREVLSATAAIGSPATPTPTGAFYVDQRLIPYDTGGPFGPGAVGIAAYSEVLTGWTQGGPIAIHGTNEPWSVGKAVSNGCIRVRNDVLRRVFDAALPGTPVVVRP